MFRPEPASVADSGLEEPLRAEAFRRGGKCEPPCSVCSRSPALRRPSRRSSGRAGNAAPAACRRHGGQPPRGFRRARGPCPRSWTALSLPRSPDPPCGAGHPRGAPSGCLRRQHARAPGRRDPRRHVPLRVHRVGRCHALESRRSGSAGIAAIPLDPPSGPDRGPDARRRWRRWRRAAASASTRPRTTAAATCRWSRLRRARTARPGPPQGGRAPATGL